MTSAECSAYAATRGVTFEASAAGEHGVGESGCFAWDAGGDIEYAFNTIEQKCEGAECYCMS